MPALKFIDIDGKRFLWREALLQRRREQVAAARVEQPALFELIEDFSPPFERTAAGRYSEPSLFAFIERKRGWLPPYPALLPTRRFWPGDGFAASPSSIQAGA